MQGVRAKVKLAAIVACCALLAACGYVDRVTKQPVTKVLLVGDSMMWARREIMDEFQSRGLESATSDSPPPARCGTTSSRATWTQQAINEFDPDLVILEAAASIPDRRPPLRRWPIQRSRPDGATPTSELMFAPSGSRQTQR
ncbi:MAG: hypothetical protein R2699_12665 [Acidimicrobiales bacterium]